MNQDECFHLAGEGMARLRVYLLGLFQVELDGRAVTKSFRTEKERALLAYLVAEASRPFSREALAELFWPEKPPGMARASLRQALAGVRKALGDRQSDRPFIRVIDETIQFNARSDYWVDADHFKGLIQSTLSHPHRDFESCQTCLGSLLEAIRLYRSSFLEDIYQVESLAFKEWLNSYREHYLRHMLSALQKAGGYYEVRGDYDTAITYTQRQVNLDPLDESARRKLIELFHKSGRRSLALEQYQVCIRILADELGVEPAPETVALYQRIKQGTVPLPRQGARQAQALPSDLTSFAGREAELARFTRCLVDSACRLLTIVGLPGAGKTRLALKVASQAREVFDDGALFFSLENVSKPDQLAPALLQGLGLSRQPGQDPEEQLLEHLSGRSALLVLDSFENLLEGTRLLIRILQNAPRVKFLVTTRQRLNYQASCLFEVGGLPYPEDARDEQVEEYPAVQMFLNRAIHSRPGFLASALTLPQIVRICKAVEGNPLALELAAANLRQYSCEHIASSLESSLSILTTGLQDIPPRHRSMLKTLDEFWSQLEPREAEAAQALSALTGRFDEQEAGQLLGASRPVLAHLVEKSVLVREQHGGFQMPALLRRYAQETALISTSLDGPPDKPEADRWDSPYLYDPATGLVSRELFWDRLNHLLAREKRRRGVFGVAVLDLFADPDAFGLTPSEKEAAIEIAAERLAARLRASDTVARLGHDEFGLVIEDIDQGGGLEAVPQKIQSVLQEAVVIGGRVISLPVRIGLSLFPADGSEARDLVDKARQARDRVEGGGPLYRYYSDRLGIKR